MPALRFCSNRKCGEWIALGAERLGLAGKVRAEGFLLFRCGL